MTLISITSLPSTSPISFFNAFLRPIFVIIYTDHPAAHGFVWLAAAAMSLSYIPRNHHLLAFLTFLECCRGVNTDVLLALVVFLLFSTLVFCLAFRTCKCTYIKHDCLAPRYLPHPNHQPWVLPRQR